MTMRKVTFIALLLAGLSGCATTQSRYGNFLPPTPAAYHKTMAEDAVKQLQILYPPASTRFDLQQTTPDTFGTTLVETMRVKGYALLESNPELPVRRSNEAQNPPTGTSLRYILDQVNSLNLYRVTLLIGNQAMTRAYRVQDSTVHPAGLWSHQE
jgi:type IV secretion system protein TrbH